MIGKNSGILKTVIECAQHCEECCALCVEENHPECIKLTGDCAQLCWNFSSFLSRGSEFNGYFAKMVEEVCEAVVKECSKYQDSDHHQRCVEMARACADECRKIAFKMPGMDRAQTNDPARSSESRQGQEGSRPSTII